MAETDVNVSRRTVVTGVVAAAASTALVVPVVLSGVSNSNVSVSGASGAMSATALFPRQPWGHISGSTVPTRSPC